MNNESTIKELLDTINQKLLIDDVKDSVHRIKFMTTRDMILELIR